MKKLRCGVVGIGYLGKFHAEKYHKLPNAELVGIVDPEKERTQKIARDFETQDYQDYRELLGKVDAVSIVTPTSSHFEIAEFFLNHGVHVLVEKPIAANLEQAQKLVDLAQKNNCKLQVGHIERYNPTVLGLKNAFKSSPRFIQAHRTAPFENSSRVKDVDVIVDLMIHDIEIIQYWLQSPIKDILAVGANVLSNITDIANASIEFENGCLANVTASRVSVRKERIMRIFEDDVYHWLDLENRVLSNFQKVEGSEAEKDPSKQVQTHQQSFPKADTLYLEIEDFVRCVLEDKVPRVTGESGKEALRVALWVGDLVQKRANTDFPKESL